MKTTIDIADPLLEQVRRVAARRGTTVEALVEQGLRTILAEERGPGVFALRDASYRGRGLQPGVLSWSWEHLGRSAYEGWDG